MVDADATACHEQIGDVLRVEAAVGNWIAVLAIDTRAEFSRISPFLMELPTVYAPDALKIPAAAITGTAEDASDKVKSASESRKVG